MRYLVIIELRQATKLGYWTNARKEFSARSMQECVKKVHKDLLKEGLYDGDYNILDIRKA